MNYFLNMVTGEIYTELTVADFLKDLNGEDIKYVGYFDNILEAKKTMLIIWWDYVLKELAVNLFTTEDKLNEYNKWKEKHDTSVPPIDEYSNRTLEFNSIKEIIDSKYVVLCLMLFIEGFEEEEYRYEAWSKLYGTKIPKIDDIICIRNGLCP